MDRLFYNFVLFLLIFNPLIVMGKTIKSLPLKISIKNSVATGQLTFQQRCSQPGVIKCVGFDQASDIAGTWGENSGIMPGTNSTPTLDPIVKAGSSGSSLKYTVSSSSANSAGSYFTNFSNDLQTQFDSGQVFYVQWRQRFDNQFITMDLGQFGNGGWKQVIIGAGDKPGCTKSTSISIDSGGFCANSCTALETVVQNTYHQGFPIMYNSCSGSSSTQNGTSPGGTAPYTPFSERYGTYDFKLQNAMPAPYCLYSQSKVNRFPPNGNCFGYFANEWITYKVKITIGTRTNDYFKGSHVDLWASREGQPPMRLFDWNWDLAAGSPVQILKYGKIWLLPYNSNNNGNNSASVPAANTWYDELIISTKDIADPK